MIGIRGHASSAAHAEDARKPLEMWAGVECTINRIGERFRDQLHDAGHYERPDDVARLASLGVRTVRYPILWERHHSDESAWKFTDRALAEFRRHDIDVVAGLVHHGSGPAFTNLLDEGFAKGLAMFAQRVARRYPWLKRFTPVNEPLTTARFAGLYGVWYPHGRSDRAFVTAMINQAHAIQLAMAAIREITPDAELVQTEDLAYIHSTPTLSYQARFENERRWLTFDLLHGRVRAGHRLWVYLRRAAPVASLLDQIAERSDDPAARPAIVGVNHYLTSERFLDDRIEAYPRRMHGGNRRHRYVDVEAVRVLNDGALGPHELLMQTWQRYRRPIVVTEAHLACTREQQMRWLHEVWTAAQEARVDGADVVAVTAWSAFGSFDWRSLLTREDGAYESGLFDLRSPEPRATALVPMVRALATTGSYDHPALDALAWWKRDERILHPARIVLPPDIQRATHVGPSLGGPSARPLLVTGAAGTLGRAFTLLSHERGLRCVARTRQQLDIADRTRVVAELEALRPWAVVNAAGWVRVDQAEHEVDACMRANAHAAHVLAEECASRGIAFVTFSSDLVFGGQDDRPYVESDTANPLNVYGRSKLEGERLTRHAMPEALIVRTSAFFGDWDDWNFVSRALATVHAGGVVQAPDDAVVSPTYVSDLVHATLDLLIDRESGVWHLANVGALSWIDLARLAARVARLDPTRIEPCAAWDIGWTAPRPDWSVLGSERGSLLPDVEDAVERYTRSRAWERVAGTLRTAGFTGEIIGPDAGATHLQATT